MRYLGYAWCSVTALALLLALVTGIHDLWNWYLKRREITREVRRSMSEFDSGLRALRDASEGTI